MKFVSLALRRVEMLTLTSQERSGDREGLLIETNEHAKATRLSASRFISRGNNV
jgi:hypothetical protein